MGIWQFAMTIAAGTMGGILAKKQKLPAGAMIGAMLAVACINVIFQQVFYPVPLRVLTQVLSGVIIGSRFSRSDILQLRQMVKPAVLLILLLLTFTVVLSAILTSVTSVDLTTAFFACAPGGVSDLALIAADLGANAQQVSLLQLVRFVFVLSFFPAFLKKGLKSKRLNVTVNQSIPEDQPQASSAPIGYKQKTIRLAVTLSAGLVGGYLFRWLQIPAGAIIGAIIATIASNLLTEKSDLPDAFRTVIQILSGCYVGSQITRQSVLSIDTLLVPMVIVIAGVLVMSFVSAVVIHRITKMDFVTCLFACVPGGISEMGLIAEDLGLDMPKIVVMHTCRVIAVICLFPVLVGFVLLIVS